MNEETDIQKQQDEETVRVVMPPVGYRMLAEGEYIRNGDIYTRTRGASWHETRSRGKYSERGYWPMARRHNAPDQRPPE